MGNHLNGGTTAGTLGVLEPPGRRSPVPGHLEAASGADQKPGRLGKLEGVGPFCSAANRQGLGTPLGVVPLSGPHQGVGNFMKQRLADFGFVQLLSKGTREGDGLPGVVAGAGASDGTVEGKAPPLLPKPMGLEEVVGQFLDSRFFHEGVGVRLRE